MKNLSPMERRLDDLSKWVESRPPDRIKMQVTSAEKQRFVEIFIDADNGQQPTQDDLFFVEEILNRPPVADLPPIDHSQPVCRACGGQPAYARDGSESMCEACWRDTLGAAYDS